MTTERKFAPRQVFERRLEYMVIPTFDLVVEYGQQGIVLVRRTIAPYQHQLETTTIQNIPVLTLAPSSAA